MKRSLFALLLILCLLLCSCAPAISGAPESTPPSEEPTATPTQPTEPPTQPTEPLPPDFSMGDTGAVTDGALRALPLDMDIYCDAYLWGEAVLLHNSQQFTFQLRSLQDGRILATCKAGANSITVTDQWLIYYAVTQKQIVFRDKNLEVVKTVDVDVSDDVAEMLFTQDGSKAFYHIYDSNTIVELDIQTGDKREIPVDGPQIWLLSDLHFEDSILRYWSKEDGSGCYGFVDLTTGKYLGKDPTITRFQSWDKGYYMCRAHSGNIVEHRMVSNGTGCGIMPQDRGMNCSETVPLPELDSFFTLSCHYESPTVILDLYNRNTNACTASLTVDLGQPYQQCTAVFADPSGEYIWLCMKVGNTSDYQMVLYRWDFRANAVTE